MDNSFSNSRDNKVLFIISGLIVLFWLLANTVDVYYFAVTGAIFEILSLPTVVILFGLPLYAIFKLWKDRFNLRSLALYSALMLIATIFILTSGVIH